MEGVTLFVRWCSWLFGVDNCRTLLMLLLLTLPSQALHSHKHYQTVKSRLGLQKTTVDRAGHTE